MGTLAAAPDIAPSKGGHPSIYRPRNPRESALYQLMEAHYEDVKAAWENRFEKRYGFWRGFVDSVVARYLDCGVAEIRFRKAPVRSMRCRKTTDTELQTARHLPVM